MPALIRLNFILSVELLIRNYLFILDLKERRIKNCIL